MNKNSELRMRNPRKKIAEIVRDLDSFPKMPTDYKQYTGIGGLVTFFMYFLMLWLILSEVKYYYMSRINNKFVPDVEFNEKLKINVDMTVAMPCHDIGADIVDVTNQESQKFGRFILKDTWFELSPEQQMYFDEVRRVNAYFREQYHSLRDILWKAGYTSYFTDMPERTTAPDYPKDACRIIGELIVNKVAGNFHITLGKSLSVPGGHIHLQQLFPFYHANFSHRIDKFSFGEPGPGMIHPLDSRITVTNNKSQVFKYFIEVVSTELRTRNRIQTYQYSVKELSKFTDYAADAHEMAGIFFKYDVNPLKIVIGEEEYTLLQLVLRILGCAGGLYISANLITNLFQAFMCYKYGEAAHISPKFGTTLAKETQSDI